jgi:hypothetical protein
MSYPHVGRVQLLTCGIVSEVEQLQTNKNNMNKDFEPGSILKQHDYIKSDKRNNELGLIAALCVGTLSFFVLKLLGAI